MATAIDADQLLDITTCPICLERYIVPKYLPCLHTFCENCIQTYISNGFQRESKQTIECPLCRTPVTIPNENIRPADWPKLLSLNFLIDGLLEKKKIQRPEKLCMICERMEFQNEASFICVDCSDLLCANCKNAHGASKSSRAHEVRPIGELSAETNVSKVFKTDCIAHTTKDLDCYCVDHELPCCSMCVSVHHRKCKRVLAIDDASKEFATLDQARHLKQELEKAESDVLKTISDRESCKDKLVLQFKDSQNKVETVFADLVANINRLKLKRDSELTKVYNEAYDNVDTMVTVFSKRQKILEKEKQILEVCVNEASLAQVMIEVKRVQKRLAEHTTFIERKSNDFEDMNISVQGTETSSIVESIERTANIQIERNKTSFQFSCLKPKRSEEYSFNRFMFSNQGWGPVASGVAGALSFKASRYIELCGFLCYISGDQKSSLSVIASVRDEAKELCQTKQIIDSSLGENKLYKIMFPTPVNIMANTKYHAIVITKGRPYLGWCGKAKVKCGGIEFNFENSDFSKNDTNVEYGEIPGFLFRIFT